MGNGYRLSVDQSFLKPNSRPAFANFSFVKGYGVAGAGLFLSTKAATNPTHKKPIIWIEM
jgi:hypothetical protein